MPTLVHLLPCDLDDWRRLLEDGDPEAGSSFAPPVLDVDDPRWRAVERLQAGQVYAPSSPLDLDEVSVCLFAYCEAPPRTAMRRRLSHGGFIEIPLAHLGELSRAWCVRERPERFASVSAWVGEARCPAWLAGRASADLPSRLEWGFLTADEFDVVVATADVVASSALRTGARRRARRIAEVLGARPPGTAAITFVS